MGVKRRWVRRLGCGKTVLVVVGWWNGEERRVQGVKVLLVPSIY